MGSDLFFQQLQLLLDYIIELIHSIQIGDPQIPYKAICLPSSSGTFTTSSTWQIVRSPRTCVAPLKGFGIDSYHSKYLFLMWRLLKKKLPFDDTIARFGRIIVSRYTCCRNPRGATMHHTFVSSDIVRST